MEVVMDTRLASTDAQRRCAPGHDLYAKRRWASVLTMLLVGCVQAPPESRVNYSSRETLAAASTLEHLEAISLTDKTADIRKDILAQLRYLIGQLDDTDQTVPSIGTASITIHSVTALTGGQFL